MGKCCEQRCPTFHPSGNGAMKLLVVDHHAVHSPNRALYRLLHKDPDIELTVVCPSSSGEYGHNVSCDPEPSSVAIMPARVLFSDRTHRMMYPGLARILRRTSPDVVYLNAEPESHLALETLLIRSLLRLRCGIVLTSWRNMDYPSTGFPYRFEVLHRWTDKVLLHYADHFVVHSQTARRLFAKSGMNRTSFIPPWVETQWISSGRPVFRPDERFVLGYVGRLVEEKGLRVLFSSLEMLPPPWHLLITGEGPLESWMRSEVTRRGWQNRVHFTGGLPRASMPDVFRSIDLLVVPSLSTPTWSEQFGRVLIEAMAAGVPVIGSDSGEIAAVIGDAGIVVPEGDAMTLTKEIGSVRDSASRRERLSILGAARVKNMFALEVVAPLYRNLFLQIVRARP